MVSLHPSLSPTRRKIIPELDNLLKRRKFNDDHHQPRSDDDDRDQIIPTNRDHHQNHPIIKGLGVMKSGLDTELHLETPIPLEWQRYLDNKSGQMYYYNTRTNKKMFNDPSSSPEPPPQPAQPLPPPPPSHSHMSLELELNLPCGSSDYFMKRISPSSSSSAGSASNSSSNDHHELITIMDSSSTHSAAKSNNKVGGGGGGGLSRAPSWLTFDGDQQEMVAAACKKCHMLVMMCKSSPACPNCKFMHPPPPQPAEQSAAATNSTAPPGLLKRRLSLLC